MSPLWRLGVLEEKFEAFWCILLVLSNKNGVRHQEITIFKINAFQATKISAENNTISIALLV